MIFHIEAKELEVINIMTAPKEKLTPLKKLVGSSGSINMLMHAYSLRDPQDEGRYPSLPGYEEERDVVVQASSNEPLVIGEEADYVRSLPLRIKRRLTSPPQHIYVCTTEYNNPYPQKPGLLRSLGRIAASFFIDQSKNDKEWDRLAGIFNWLGVKDTALGGQNLTYYDADSANDPEIPPRLQEQFQQCLQEYLENLSKTQSGKLQIPDAIGTLPLLPIGCVGWTAQFLIERGFNVSLTLPSSPRAFLNVRQSKKHPDTLVSVLRTNFPPETPPHPHLSSHNPSPQS